MIKTGQVFMPPYRGTNKLTLEGYDHLTWRHKLIPYIRTDNCTDMSNMFSGEGYSLPETLDLRNFNTEHVTTMRSMFEDCMSETILGLNIFDTSNVEDMNSMFCGSKATELDLSSFNTSSVEDMGKMFYGSAATELDISGFDTSSVTDMNSMFRDVTAEIDVTNFDTSNVTDMSNMFRNTSGTVLDLSNFDTSLVEDMNGMFMNANYEEIDWSSFDTSNVENMSYMFDGCTVEDIDISTFDMSNVIDASYMFANIAPETFVFSDTIDTSNIENIEGLFCGATLPALDLTGISFPSAENQKEIFKGLNTELLDISDWDLGANSSTENEGYSYPLIEWMFDRADIHEIRFSNSNVFPEGYNVAGMFFNFTTDGTLDLSSFVFNKAVSSGTSTHMFEKAKINTLIFPDIIQGDTFYTDGVNDIYELFNGAAIELLDMSNSTIGGINPFRCFNGLVATRVNMPNIVPVGQREGSVYYPSAKYVDYSAVDTRNGNYELNQWRMLSYSTFSNTKIVWIPSTFVLNGQVTMYNLCGDVYTDALNYAELGWDIEPTNAVMHYGTTHSDFEQAILNDDPDDWDGAFFFCHKSVPLNSVMTINQFDGNYSNIYLDDEPIEDGYVFDEVGTFVLKINKTTNRYDYTQKITVVNHGNSYSVVGNPYDYKWSSTNYTYTSSLSTKIECRLYSDNYLFIYPLARLTNVTSEYTVIETLPSSNVVKVSGVPWGLRRFNLSGASRLTDISELIIRGSSFNPNGMFYNCTNLTDVSVIDKWNAPLRYSYYRTYTSYGRTYVETRYEDFNHGSMFYNTHITSAPAISLYNATSTFYNCAYLTDISKLQPIYSPYSSGNLNFYSTFRGCSRLLNVSRLKDILRQGFTYDFQNFLSGTAITNIDFIPDDGISVRNIYQMFSDCSQLTDISGASRFVWSASTYENSFGEAFSGTAVTDFSPIAGWDAKFTSVDMYNTRITNLSFLSSWDLSNCTYYNFNACSYLTSISVLTNKIITDQEITVMTNNCTALTSLTGLEGCILSSSSAFNSCTSLTSLSGLTGCTISNGTSLFYGCTSLTDITAFSTITFTGTSINSMFYGCTSLASLNGLQSIDVSNMTQLVAVFSGCTSLTDLSALAGWNPYQVTNVQNLFNGCRSITSFAALQNWVTSQLTNITGAFTNCSSLINLGGLMGFNVARCTTLAGLFQGCTALTDISDITMWYIANVTNLSNMFRDCPALTSITPLKNWNVTRLSNMTYMFYGDTSIADASILEDWKNIRTMTSVSRNYAFYNVPRPIPTWATS